MSFNPIKDYEKVKRKIELLEKHVPDKKQLFVLKKIVQGVEKLKECASSNPVTGYRGLHQRNYDIEQIKKRRYDRKFDFYIVMIDIDNFGKFNKKYGEHIGNLVLKSVTHILEEGTREYDVIAKGYHLHGEELQVILQAPSKETAIHVSERLRKAIDEHSTKVTKGYHVTATFGVTKWSLNKETFETAQKRADRAMAKGKKIEKNKSYYR